MKGWPDAYFQAIRWADNGGEPFCPRCECQIVYAMTTRRLWKCKACRRQFSVTSATIFASRKLPIRDYLAAIAVFVNAVKGVSALQLGRDLNVQYRTAFVLAHKLREAIGDSQKEGTLSGEVEVDGAYFGVHVKPANEGRGASKAKENEGRRQSFVVARERGGRGQHHHISGKYLLAYACEMAWKEDNRRVANGSQHEAITGLALTHPVSPMWAGYWQRAQ